MKEEKKSIKEVLGKLECYTANIAELVDEVEDEVIEDENGKVILELKTVVGLLQVFWDKFKETAFECEEKEIEVKLPDGLIGSLLAAALAVVGFKL